MFWSSPWTNRNTVNEQSRHIIGSCIESVQTYFELKG